jgi:hypothetical protein
VEEARSGISVIVESIRVGVAEGSQVEMKQQLRDV